MSEQVTSASLAPAAGASSEKVGKRPCFAVAQALANELTLSAEIAGTAAKTAYATALAEEGIDAAFVEGFRANDHVGE